MWRVSQSELKQVPMCCAWVDHGWWESILFFPDSDVDEGHAHVNGKNMHFALHLRNLTENNLPCSLSLCCILHLGLRDMGNRRPAPKHKKTKIKGQKTKEVKPSIPSQAPVVENLSPQGHPTLSKVGLLSTVYYEPCFLAHFLPMLNLLLWTSSMTQ